MNIKETLKGISAFALYLILSNTSVTLLQLLNINFKNWSSTTKSLYNIGYELIMIIIIILIFRKTIVEHFKKFKNNIKGYFNDYIKYWLYAIALMYISNFIIISFTQQIAQNEQSIRNLFSVNPLYIIILSCFLAPILEELVFRLSLQKILNKYSYLFIIISGLIFGYMHIASYVQTNPSAWLYIIPYGLPGSIFAYTLVKSDNIFIPIMLHAINNTYAIVLQILLMFL